MSVRREANYQGKLDPRRNANINFTFSFSFSGLSFFDSNHSRRCHLLCDRAWVQHFRINISIIFHFCIFITKHIFQKGFNPSISLLDFTCLLIHSVWFLGSKGHLNSSSSIVACSGKACLNNVHSLLGVPWSVGHSLRPAKLQSWRLGHWRPSFRRWVVQFFPKRRCLHCTFLSHSTNLFSVQCFQENSRNYLLHFDAKKPSDSGKHIRHGPCHFRRFLLQQGKQLLNVFCLKPFQILFSPTQAKIDARSEPILPTKTTKAITVSKGKINGIPRNKSDETNLLLRFVDSNDHISNAIVAPKSLSPYASSSYTPSFYSEPNGKSRHEPYNSGNHYRGHRSAQYSSLNGDAQNYTRLDMMDVWWTIAVCFYYLVDKTYFNLHPSIVLRKDRSICQWIDCDFIVIKKFNKYDK